MLDDVPVVARKHHHTSIVGEQERVQIPPHALASGNHTLEIVGDDRGAMRTIRDNAVPNRSRAGNQYPTRPDESVYQVRCLPLSEPLPRTGPNVEDLSCCKDRCTMTLPDLNALQAIRLPDLREVAEWSASGNPPDYLMPTQNPR